MKTRFTTLDIISILEELQQYVGMRVNQVYDVDNKTYLIKLHQPDKKVVLLIESGTRLHTTEFEWPKNPAPSGFSMKLRKHINNKRLVHIKQLGIDRVVDLQFGDGEAAHHLILEMYDRGNLVLTDFELKILNILRPRVAGEERFLVRETYPVELAKQEFSTLDEAALREAFGKARETDTLKKVLMPHFDLGPALLEHLLLQESLRPSSKLKEVDLDIVLPSLLTALQDLPSFLKNREKQGYVIQKAETRPRAEGGEEEFLTIQEFHPFLYSQHASSPYTQHETFNGACDIFFSQVEAQRIELKSVQQERNAVKKLENVKKDHETRIKSLQELQDLDRLKGELIEMNNEIVDNAIKVILSAIANQIPWDQIKEIIKEATENRDPVASRIKQIKLETNHIVMQLEDPYAHLDYDDDDSDEDDSNDKKKDKAKEHLVDIDLGLTAQANARKYFVQKKSAAVKERKTLESGGVALKSAEKKTKAALKEMAKISTIIKARKVYWFEKFFWFISSENFLVIGGRDAQQNELLVKRYMKPTDIYVHADLHGAATVIVKNPSSDPVPPKTLNEAGQFAVCFSAAWDSKVLTAAYWVTPDQVSKTAPSGEYLTVGSFMIRGKKNFLPPSQLTMGFAFLFCLTEDSLERHKDERKIRGLEESKQDVKEDESVEELAEKVEDVEIDVEGGDSSDEETEAREPLEEIKEEVEDNDGSEDHIREDVIEEPGLNADEGDNSDASEEGEEEMPAPQTTTDESSSNVIEFPDTDVKIGYDRLGSVEIKTRTVSTSEDHIENEKKGSSNNKEKTKFQDGFKPQKGQKNPGPPKEKGGGRAAPAWKIEEESKKSDHVRGKKGKMKKMKEKYKDQDDEERELRMKLLQSSGAQDEEAKGRKKKKENRGLEKLYGKSGTGGNKGKGPSRDQKPREHQPKVTEGEGAVEEEKVVDDETNMLTGLTGMPLMEDELLFAVPVVAPYSTVLQYKYKVKLTPGTGKRGKACKTALAMFLADKATAQREKDLLKSVKDQDLARNLPGKVKLSAPHLQKVKAKK